MAPKARPTTGVQAKLMLGFIWDSITSTRTLEEAKLSSYSPHTMHFAHSRSICLRDSQKLAGRIQSAVMTLPPRARDVSLRIFSRLCGACLCRIKCAVRRRRSVGTSPLWRISYKEI
eukprot:2467290-Pleurochrysis_carterae.AAC.1